ncbi:isopeptide-forming domain-containing fimbrial protein [Nitriliruptoraceae bacterium ZYF776]|nr:isopeptide-forming domain-containing fimbrial protein [Profundirhabdus halotolerans]
MPPPGFSPRPSPLPGIRGRTGWVVSPPPRPLGRCPYVTGGDPRPPTSWMSNPMHPAAARLREGPSLATRLLVLLLATSLALAATVWRPGLAAAQTAPSVTATIDGDERILAGEDGVLSLRATGAGAWGYNLAFVVTAPVGLQPLGSAIGAPRVVAHPSDPALRLWIFEDVADLPAGGTFALDVDVRPVQPPVGGGQTADPNVFPVGSVADVRLDAHLSSDANLLPWFVGSSAVNPPASEAVTVSATDTHQLDVAALRVTKWEPSPEAELLRGVHDHTTTYHVRVENTSEGITGGAVVVDYLPAGLEFLGCGTVDNTTVDRAGTGSVHEYPTSGDLTGTPAVAPMSAYDANGEREGCLTPLEVVTVVDDPDAPSDAVYTRVTWDLGDLPAGSVTELVYAAGIPLYENTADFDGAGGAPSGASLDQTANLDNNNGPSTRQVGGHDPAGDGTVYRNVAEARGQYQGVVRTGTDRAVSDDDDELVHAMDLAVLKDVDRDSFVAADTAIYSLLVRTSEYTSSDGIVLTDTIPNGLCPLLPTGTPTTGDALPAECDLTDAAPAVTGATVTSVGYDAATGEFTLVLEPTGQPVPASDTREITYPVRMRASYTDSTGATGPTTSLDSFDNHVTIIGDTTSIPPLTDWFPASEQVWDDSGAALESDATEIAKRVAPRTAVTPDLPADANPCPTDAGEYGEPDQPGFRFGDVACFELTVTFPTTVDTRNPVVTDILPAELLSYVGWAPGDAASAALLEADAFTAAGRRLEWQVGTTGAGGDRFVASGSQLRLIVWAEVARPAAGTTTDKPQNLMKYRQENVDGDVFFLRDQAAIDVEPGVSLLKGVRDVDGDATRPADSQANPDGTVVDSNRDGVRVVEGEEVTYRVDLTAPDFPVGNLVVWDSLPTGIACADVVDLGTATCHDPGSASFPSGLSGSHAARSVLVWSGLSIAAESSVTLLYAVEIPVGTSVSRRLVNTASITSYTSGTNVSTDPAAQSYHPSGSLDTDLEDEWNAPGADARDDSNVFLPNATVAKSVTSEVLPADDPNNAGNEVVTGELATFTYAVTIPAHTTVYDAVLSDQLPAALTLFDVVGWTFDDGTGAVPGALPGFALQSDVGAAGPGSLTFPATYRNDSASPQVFAVTVRAFVADGHSLTHGNTVTNTARFTSNQTLGGAPVPPRTATSTVRYIEPAPRIVKAVTDVDGQAPTGTPPQVDTASEVTYTLTVTNLGGRPISHDTVVVDCVPAGLDFDRYETTPAGVTTVAAEPGDDANGCADGTTRLAWDLGAVAPGDSVQLSYVVTVDPTVGGGAQYVNETEVTGYTLPENPESGDRGDASDDDDAVVEVVGATIDKTVAPATAAVGETVTYDVVVTLPADANFYDAAIVDQVPAGIAVSAATCTPDAASVTCTAPDPATTDGGTAQSLTWSLGDVASAPTARTVTISYTGTVVTTEASTPADLDPVAGDQLVNTATLSWRTAPGGGGEEREVEDDATVTVTEPELVIDKLVEGVDHEDVVPGDTFTYTVRVANVGTSAAYDVTVTDDVPLGVVVDPATISDGGQLAGADAVRGGGTITWTLDTLAVGAPAAVTFTYDATLAPSETLDTSTLPNVASVDEYFSADDSHDDRRSYEGPDDDAAVTPQFPSVTVGKDVTDGRQARVGEPFGWTITVVSDGDIPADAVTVVDTLPHGWDYDATVDVAIDGQSVLPTPQPTVGTSGGRTTLDLGARDAGGR